MGIVETPGHKKIKQYCLDAAKELGLEVDGDDVSWAEDIITKEHILTIEATTGISEITFLQQEIEDYVTGVGVDEVHNKIRESLQAIRA
ncbi:MAG: hypothetical protein HY323_09915 [Betaproteobacteria bacterium]|nr:hypothetical protein [Betaproteobacteria bacterium]MBI3937282.1 hypothetical protein [Betaproteobacteria bacterium]